MANGTLIDEATYYGDSEKYTGNSGTATNMYVIEDAYDLITSQTVGTNNLYYRFVNDIDFNDHSEYKKGFTKSLYSTSYAKYFYGDGHKIKNIVAMNTTTSVFYFNTVQDIDFVNVISINSTVFPIAVKNVNNCDFGVFFSNSQFAINNGTFSDCTFNCKGTLSGNVFKFQRTSSNVQSFSRCYFNFDVTSPIRNSANTYGAIFNNGSYTTTYTNCYFTGKITDLSTEVPDFTYRFVEFINCYFAFEYKSNYEVGNSNSANATYSTSFIDKELFERSGVAWNVENFPTLTALTTAQAQDSNYLNSIGFAVIPIE